MDEQSKVLADVARERDYQDRQWAGAEHDDAHTDNDWWQYICYQYVHRMRSSPRERFIKIAALAVAAVESIDRKNAKGL
jgi:hypothetical protein